LRRLHSPTLQLRDLTLVWGKATYVMGIINVTPDSFSGDGLLTAHHPKLPIEAVVERAMGLVADGADILDVGGESTRPGSTPVSTQEELARVIPAIRAIRQASGVPISVDTYHAEVAAAAIEAGADLVNDVWGLRLDPAMAGVVAAAQVPVVLTHNRSRPKNAEQRERLGGRYVGVAYDDLIGDVLAELGEQVKMALAAGIAPERILVDPGLGFGKTVEQSLQLVRRAGELGALGYPILFGPSRKSFIGYTLELPPEERIEGTLAAIGAAVLQGGADIVRVHDVKQTKRFVRMLDAIRRA